MLALWLLVLVGRPDAGAALIIGKLCLPTSIHILVSLPCLAEAVIVALSFDR